MTQEQLKELERLNERWANECPTQVEWTDVGRCVMDLLPDVLAHIKQLTELIDKANHVGYGNAVTLQIERIQRERDEARETASRSAKDIVSLEDKLGKITGERDTLHSKVVSEGRAITRIVEERDAVKAQRDAVQDRVDDEWLTTIGNHWLRLTGNPWETRDGETREEGLQSNITALFQVIEDRTADLAAAHKACAEMEKACGELLSWATIIANDARTYALTSSGDLTTTLKNWFERDHQPNKPFGSGHIHRNEIKPLLMVLEDIATDDLDRVSGGVKQSAQEALTRVEKLLKGETK